VGDTGDISVNKVLEFVKTSSRVHHNKKAVSILLLKYWRLGWSYCAASPKLGRNEV